MAEWHWREKQAVRLGLEALGWVREPIWSAPGHAQLRKGAITARLDEERTIGMNRVLYEEPRFRRTESVGDVGPFYGRGWVERTITGVEDVIKFVETVRRNAEAANAP